MSKTDLIDSDGYTLEVKSCCRTDCRSTMLVSMYNRYTGQPAGPVRAHNDGAAYLVYVQQSLKPGAVVKMFVYKTSEFLHKMYDMLQIGAISRMCRPKDLGATFRCKIHDFRRQRLPLDELI